MRILATGDDHISEHSKRWSECQKVHQWIVDVVQDEHIDLVLNGGDVYDGPSTPIDREFASDIFIRIGAHASQVVAKGNHDIYRDCQILAKLKTDHPIHVEERAGVVHMCGAAIGVMAWPERGGILASKMQLELGYYDPAELTQSRLERRFGKEHVENVVRDSLQAVLRGLGSQLAEHNGPRVLLGHFMVNGAMTSTGQPLLGSPMNVSLDELALANAHIGLMSHIHMAQCFDVNGAPHHYSGSPYRTDYGQLEPKGVLIAEFDDATGKLIGTRFIESPCAKLEHVELWWEDDHFTPQQGGLPYLAVFPDLSNTELRLRYHVPVDQREAAERRANEIADAMRSNGVISVKIEPLTKATKRARAPEVAKAYAIRDKLLAYWPTIGFEPGNRMDALLVKASELEEQVRLESKGESSANA
jgi:DNA repair exonuclease SbcCD nuclease subunit